MTSDSSNVRLRGRRQGLADGRALLAAAAAAAALAAALAAGASWPVALVVAWDAAALTFLVRVFSTILRCDASDDTETHVALRLRALEARLSRSPAIVGALLSLSAPDEPTLLA